MQRLVPKDEAETAAIVRAVAERGDAVEIVSGGSKRDYGRPVTAEAMLDVRALSGIVKYEPEELVLTAKAGTRLTEIGAALNQKKQMLGFEPADWGPVFGGSQGRATLGGTLAANACGARRIKAGAVRDHTIGCRFVNGMGEAVHAGGNVIKNVTGFDVPKLMCGAFGTLGVLTEVTMRVTPAPERVATLVVRNVTAGQGLKVLREAAGLAVEPTGLVYLPAAMLSGDMVAAVFAKDSGAALIRVEGTKPAIQEKLAFLRTHFAGRDITRFEDDMTRAIFQQIGNGGFFIGKETDIWRLCVPATHAADAVDEMKPALWYADWAGGLLWLGLPGDDETAVRLRALTARTGGHATLMRAQPLARSILSVFEPEPRTRAELTRAVKAAFDPKHLFNPERMFENC